MTKFWLTTIFITSQHTNTPSKVIPAPTRAAPPRRHNIRYVSKKQQDKYINKITHARHHTHHTSFLGSVQRGKEWTHAVGTVTSREELLVLFYLCTLITLKIIFILVNKSSSLWVISIDFLYLTCNKIWLNGNGRVSWSSPNFQLWTLPTTFSTRNMIKKF